MLFFITGSIIISLIKLMELKILDIIYKQIPNVNENLCPICHKVSNTFKPVQVLFYNQINGNTSLKSVYLLNCPECDISFADKTIFREYYTKRNNYRPIFFNPSKINNICELNNKISSTPILFDASLNIRSKNNKITNQQTNDNAIFPLSSVNINSSIKNIFITPFYNKCVNCQNHTIDFVNTIPISNTNCVKIKGKYCSHCDMFFYENSSHIEELLNNNPFALSYKTIYDFYIDKSILNKNARIKSAICIFYLKELHSDISKKIVIVSTKKCASNIEDIYHYSDVIARTLLSNAYHSKKKEVVLNNKHYLIVNSEQINNKLIDSLIIKNLIIGKNEGLLSASNKKKTFDILLYSPYNDRYEIIKAFYDSEYNFYYVDMALFKSFLNIYGNPGIPVKVLSEKNFGSLNYIKDESILRAYGYSVSQNENLTDSKRQEIIADVLDLGLMKSKEILALLNFLINSHKDSKYDSAKIKWKKDAEFTMNYKINPQRFITAES